jgi:hypothetical protein
LVVILPMYFLDVQTQDLLARQDQGLEISTNALEKLTNLYSTDTTRYFLEHKDILAQFQQASSGSFCRKVYLALHPNVDRFVFYVFPWLLVYFITTLPYRKSAATQPATQVDLAKKRRDKPHG